MGAITPDHGWHLGVPEDVYHQQWAAVSRSNLVRVLRSPAHAMADRGTSPGRAMVVGSACHALALEGPEAYAARYAVAPRVDRRTKAGKVAWAAFSDMSKMTGQEVLTAVEGDQVEAMAMAARAFKPFAELLDQPHTAEGSLVWTDKDSGLLCKARPDLAAEGVLVDFKTSRDARPRPFARDAVDYGLDMQAAFYLDGWRAVHGESLRGKLFAFCVVEKTAPHGVVWYYPDDAMIDNGRARYKRALALWAYCVEAGEWPSYSNQPQMLSLPPWAIDQTERSKLDRAVAKVKAWDRHSAPDLPQTVSVHPLRIWCATHGLRLSQVATTIGVGRSALSNYVAGRRACPDTVATAVDKLTGGAVGAGSW